MRWLMFEFACLTCVHNGLCKGVAKNLAEIHRNNIIVDRASDSLLGWQDLGKPGHNAQRSLTEFLLAVHPSVSRRYAIGNTIPSDKEWNHPNKFRLLQRKSNIRVQQPRMILQPSKIRIVLFLLALVGKFSIKVIGTADTMLIERFGVYNRKLDAGLHFTIPLIERTSFEITQREQVLDIPPQACITKDNAPLSADAVVYFKVVDPERARYAVKDVVLALQNLVLTQLRSEIGKLTLDDTFCARQQINSILLEDLDRATADWGVKVTRVEVRDIMPSRDIMSAMEMQMSAERKKRAAILDSEGRRESQVNDARGQADAVKLQAEAEASRLEAVAQGEASSLRTLVEATQDLDKAMQIALLTKYWKTQAELAASNNTKVLFYPSKATVPVTADALREMLSAE